MIFISHKHDQICVYIKFLEKRDFQVLSWKKEYITKITRDNKKKLLLSETQFSEKTFSDPKYFFATMYAPKITFKYSLIPRKILKMN